VILEICEMWFKISVFLWVVIIFLGFMAHFTTDQKMFLKLIMSMFILVCTSGLCALVGEKNKRKHNKAAHGGSK
jgi:predicted RND superfamily exporter protein